MSGKRIVHFDIAYANFAAYFLAGLDANQDRFGYRFSIRSTPPRALADLYDSPYSQAALSIPTFQVRNGDEQFYFCIDSADANDYVYEPLLERVRYYFKVNWHPEVLNASPWRQYIDKIRPAGPFFPIRFSYWRQMPRRMLPYRAVWRYGDVRTRLMQVKKAATLKQLVGLRGMPKQQDVAFVVPLYHKDTHREHNEFRYEIVRRLREANDIDAVAGVVGNNIPERYADCVIPMVSQQRHLMRVASSRVAIYVRGLHDCVSYKFGELLSQGLPIAGQSVVNNVACLMAHEGMREQFCYDDPVNLVDRVRELLENNALRSALSASNERVFDHHFAPTPGVAKLLDTIF